MRVPKELNKFNTIFLSFCLTEPENGMLEVLIGHVCVI